MIRRRTPPAVVRAMPARAHPGNDTAAWWATGQAVDAAFLVATGLVDPDQLGAAELQRSVEGGGVAAVLVASGALDDRRFAAAVSEHLDLPMADLGHEAVEAGATGLVEPDLARQLALLPTRVLDGVLHVAIVDPTDPRVAEALAGLARTHALAVTVGADADVRTAVNQAYRSLSDVHAIVSRFERAEVPRPDPVAAPDAGDDEIPVVQLVDRIVVAALRDRASDVHLEPRRDSLRVRFRIDGALTDALSLPAAMAAPVVSRIKILAGMSIVERRRPQDGQFQMQVDDREVDVRVATVATLDGEKAVLRLLDRTREMLRLSDLGMSPGAHARFARLAAAPFGMVLCAGPTGSGKTTTLYAAIDEISRPDLNITTIEDPVEYVVDDVNQIQINEQAGVTFAVGLKSILRQDPDVILVGEVRDPETARIAVDSALTGHLVLSSLHATDAAAALHRLLDMGIEPFRVASAMAGVIGQRLVRRICRACATPTAPAPAERDFYRRSGGPDKDEFVAGAGCNLCNGTGFHGRIGVYEVLEFDDELRHLLASGGSPQDLRRAASAGGATTLLEEALGLVAADVTTIAEITRSVAVAA